MKSRRLPIVLLSAAVVALLIACVVLSFYAFRSDDDSVASAPGTVLGHEPMLNPPPAISTDGATATRVQYSSTSGVDGSKTAESGVVFVPKGPVPDGGRKIVAYGHGTSGVTDDCAPSNDSGLFGSAPAVSSLVAAGYVVTVPDYQGLGTAGEHPYLHPKSAAYSMIDAVRAARELVPDTSTSWAAVGDSQGGQASWATGQYADSYGKGLDYVGTVAMEPAADLRFMVDNAVSNTLNPAQQELIPLLVRGLRVVHPELNPDDYLHGTLAAEQSTLLACTMRDDVPKFALAARLAPSDTAPATPQAAERLRGWIDAMVVTETRSPQPMLMVYGDNDVLLPEAVQDKAFTDACSHGDVIQRIVQPGANHGGLQPSMPAIVTWVGDRFAGRPAPNNC